MNVRGRPCRRKVMKSWVQRQRMRVRRQTRCLEVHDRVKPAMSALTTIGRTHIGRTNYIISWTSKHWAENVAKRQVREMTMTMMKCGGFLAENDKHQERLSQRRLTSCGPSWEIISCSSNSLAHWKGPRYNKTSSRILLRWSFIDAWKTQDLGQCKCRQGRWKASQRGYEERIPKRRHLNVHQGKPPKHRTPDSSIYKIEPDGRPFSNDSLNWKMG